MKTAIFEEVTSTNDAVLQYLPARENVIVCARRQTEGRGTKGRSFLSGEGGVYLSALLLFEELRAANAFLIMAHAAVSVCRTAEEFGVTAQIKWANDVLVGGKKLCGILVENALKGDFVERSVIGIGVNVANDVSSLGGIAVTLSEAAGRPLSCDDVRDALIKNFCKKSSFSDYLARVAFLGKEVLVTEGEKTSLARALSVLPDGRLEIEQGGVRRALSSAEISVKI